MRGPSSSDYRPSKPVRQPAQPTSRRQLLFPRGGRVREGGGLITAGAALLVFFTLALR